MTKCCPTCGHPLPEDEVLFDLSKKQVRLFIALKRAGSAGITVEDLSEQLYKDERNGGPMSAVAYTRIQLTQMNKVLARHGLYITRKRSTIRRLEARPVRAAKTSLVRVK